METIKLIEKARAKAKEIFTNYSQIDEIFITSDLQGFTSREKAESHTAYLENNKIQHFHRHSDFEEPKNEEDNEGDVESDSEREALVAEYEKLFGKKPPQNIGIDTLKNKIAEKKKETESQHSETADEKTQE